MKNPYELATEAQQQINHQINTGIDVHDGGARRALDAASQALIALREHCIAGWEEARKNGEQVDSCLIQITRIHENLSAGMQHSLQLSETSSSVIGKCTCGWKVVQPRERVLTPSAYVEEMMAEHSQINLLSTADAQALRNSITTLQGQLARCAEWIDARDPKAFAEIINPSADTEKESNL